MIYRPAQGMRLSTVGIGTYLGHADDATDARYTDAIVAAVRGGVNVIDTASNYRRGRSERCVGEALRRLDGIRGDVVLCTKAGFTDRGGHALEPSFLNETLGRSLERMGVTFADVFYLHNPETQIGDPAFEAMMRAAFVECERLVEQGLIRYYGTATWDGFRVAGQLEIERLASLARAVAGEGHHFRFVQMPVNLAMREALQRGVTVRATELGITCVASASLLQARLASGLPEALRDALGPELTDAQCALQFTRSAPGVTVALAGMSRVEHVVENLGIADVAPLDHVRF